MNAVIMGRLTWESLPVRFRPLPERLNIVCSRSRSSGQDLGSDCVSWQKSLDDALEYARSRNIDRSFVIGGGQLYSQAVNHPLCAGLYVTEVFLDINECDTVFPEIGSSFLQKSASPIQADNGIEFRFVEYCRTGVA
mmetsp:Transcript_25096/g.41338  ORF Transcript_25096/g.41338 Transcript_25096/m.41338 type:complete len:137 (+) Transcript_25096:184-594(+)